MSKAKNLFEGSDEAMKLNSEFVLRTIAGESMLVPIGETSGRLNGVISLNPIGASIWTALAEKCEPSYALDRIVEEYDIDRDTAAKDIDDFLNKLKELELMIE